MPAPLSLPSAKKRKTCHAATIEQLEATLTSALSENGSLNPLADLTSLTASLSDPQDLHKAIYALYRIFVLIIDSNRICGELGESEEAKLVRLWLNKRLAEFVTVLSACLKNDQKGIRTSALDILFSILKHLSEAYSKSSSLPQLHMALFRKILHSLLLVDVKDGVIGLDVRDHFVTNWLNVHDDIRWFFLRESATLLYFYSKYLNTRIAENILLNLEQLSTMPTKDSELNKFWIASFSSRPSGGVAPPLYMQDDPAPEDPVAEDDWRIFFDGPETIPTALTPAAGNGQSQRVYRLSTHQCLHSLSSHRSRFTLCWMALLPHLSNSAKLSARALKFLHLGVLPHFDQPMRLMDWIGGCVDFGGSVGLLAFNALFTLMQEQNLDYPNFYIRLYASLTRDVLYLKHRSRFFRLMELFLSSSHLPAALLASFIKRLSRLSLSAPPAAIVMIIPFTYNILKRHPACMVLIHRDAQDFEPDPFDANEPSPYFTNALSSSLWELASHRNHYHAPVASLARIFSESFTKPGYAMEDFLDHTYSTLFDAEAKRTIKMEPPLALELRGNLFPSAKDVRDDNVDLGADPVSELWHFGSSPD